MTAETQGFERTQSLDNDEFNRIHDPDQSTIKLGSTASSSEDPVYDEPSLEYRPRTNTMPQASPKSRYGSSVNRAQSNIKDFTKPVPTPRRFHSQLEQRCKIIEPIYDEDSGKKMVKPYEKVTISFTHLPSRNRSTFDEATLPQMPEKRTDGVQNQAHSAAIYAQVKKTG